MLWIEITPKAALTPHCSRKAATTAPTVTWGLLWSVMHGGKGLRRCRCGCPSCTTRAAKRGKGSRARLRSEAPGDPAGCVCSAASWPLQAAQSSDLSSRASKRRRHWPDSTRPIRMPLTRTPCGANSVAIERTRFSRPARAAEVATMCGSGWRASSELAQTMAASPSTARCAASCGRKARVGWMTEKNLRCSSSVQAASSVSAKVETRPWPALLISIDGRRRARPRWPRRRRCTEAASSTSQVCAKSVRLRAALAQAGYGAVAAARRCGRTARRRRRSRSSSSTVARPMPDEPPVTTATRPASASAAKKEGDVACRHVVGLQALRSGTTLALPAGCE